VVIQNLQKHLNFQLFIFHFASLKEKKKAVWASTLEHTCWYILISWKWWNFFFEKIHFMCQNPFFPNFFLFFLFLAKVIKIRHPKSSLGINWRCFCFFFYFNIPILPLLQNPMQKKNHLKKDATHVDYDEVSIHQIYWELNIFQNYLYLRILSPQC